MSYLVLISLDSVGYVNRNCFIIIIVIFLKTESHIVQVALKLAK